MMRSVKASDLLKMACFHTLCNLLRVCLVVQSAAVTIDLIIWSLLRIYIQMSAWLNTLPSTQQLHVVACF